MTIWKYELVTTDAQAVEMPTGAEVLCVQVQGNVPCLWARVDPNQPRETRRFLTSGTGHIVGISPKYIGTYQLLGGSLVFHVFEDR